MDVTSHTAGPLRVVLVDDHPLVRAGVRRSLEDCADIEVVGEAGTGAEALSCVEGGSVDVILLDLVLPDEDGLDTLRTLRRRGSQAAVVILTGVSDAHTPRAALEAGASGYLTKDRASPEALAEVVRSAGLGLVAMDPRSMAAAVDGEDERAGEDWGLTPREREVWALLMRGLSNPQIARALSISERTAKFHVGNLLTKTGTRSRNEVTALAFRRGASQSSADRYT